MSIIKIDDAAMDILRQELKPLDMQIGYSDRAGYFITDAASSETMCVVQDPKRFIQMIRRFNERDALAQVEARIQSGDGTLQSAG
jgi:hypothetical protein